MNAVCQHLLSLRKCVRHTLDTSAHTHTHYAHRVWPVANSKTCLTSLIALLISVSGLSIFACVSELCSQRLVLISLPCVYSGCPVQCCITVNCHATLFCSCWMKSCLASSLFVTLIAKSGVYSAVVESILSYPYCILPVYTSHPPGFFPSLLGPCPHCSSDSWSKLPLAWSSVCVLDPAFLDGTVVCASAERHWGPWQGHWFPGASLVFGSSLPLPD